MSQIGGGARVAINRTALKNYAPKARREFIAAIAARAAKFGITKGDPLPMQEQGDLVIIDGEAFSKKIGTQRKKLLTRIQLHGFEQTMEEVAYTWFNRFLAIRYMELHGFLDHGYRILSHPDGRDLPEILEHAEHLDLTGLNKDKVIDLKLEGDKDAELYRLLLIAQCNALHRAMPFLFEKIDDETELLLPDNLLHTDSLIRKLVTGIDEADWQEIEIVGWLYQFYISEKKDEVIGKVVKSEDIPAATQLFTPNWIVKYMVQNSLGAQWMATYPESDLKWEMDYYITPVEQTEEVQRQLAEITPKSLNPEEITLIDPAAGSGHILVEAYDVFKAIYLERGYRLRDIPRLILKKNLYGLDIDDRAAQMAGFALLMRARADDRRILSTPVKLNVMAIQSSEGVEAAELVRHLLPKGRFELIPNDDLLPDTMSQPTLAAEIKSEVKDGTIESLINLFAEAKTYGSLITVPDNIIKALPALKALVQTDEGDDLYRREAKLFLASLVVQAEILARKYDNVVANPPYMGGKFMIASLKQSLKNTFEGGANDIYCAFVLRSIGMAREYVSMITMETWMFVVSYATFRSAFFSRACFRNACHLPYEGKKPTAMGINFGTIAFSARLGGLQSYNGSFCRQRYFDLQQDGTPREVEALKNCFYTRNNKSFEKIPTSPIAFDASEKLLSIFDEYEAFGDDVHCKDGMTTGSNDVYVRQWSEIDSRKFNKPSESIFSTTLKKPWVPYSKGGDFRRWYGNNYLVLFWGVDGSKIKSNSKSVIRNEKYYFKSAITWTLLSNYGFGARLRHEGFAFDTNGKSAFPKSNSNGILGYLNSTLVKRMLELINPTIAFQAGDIGRLPKPRKHLISQAQRNSGVAQKISRADWDAYEISWDFSKIPLLHPDHHQTSLSETYNTVRTNWQEHTLELQWIEEENNRLFIDAYGLQDELTPEVPLKEITLTCNPHYRYGGNKTEDELEALLLTDSMKELISYAIGCMMGRYSFAEPGLIYAHSDNEGFDPSLYGDFPADDDGITPITDTEWFDDDATRRFEKFIKNAWSEETLRENLAFIADALKNNGSSDPLATIRNYLTRQFYKDHLKTYNKRPIYWLFSSGKLKAFECLVYLHRYNEGTLSRMRMEYVTPLQSRMAARIDQLTGDIAAASSTPERNRKQKEKDKLVKQLEELRKFDEELRHYADKRIILDLDDGVKVNYGKFGNLLAETKNITGKKD